MRHIEWDGSCNPSLESSDGCGSSWLSDSPAVISDPGRTCRHNVQAVFMHIMANWDPAVVQPNICRQSATTSQLLDVWPYFHKYFANSFFIHCFPHVKYLLQIQIFKCVH